MGAGCRSGCRSWARRSMNRASSTPGWRSSNAPASPASPRSGGRLHDRNPGAARRGGVSGLRPARNRQTDRSMTETAYRIHGDTGEWEVVIGLEVHAQITTRAKLFSGASTQFGAEPNAQVSLVDAAMPGMLPVPNRECIRQAVRTGMAIEAEIN